MDELMEVWRDASKVDCKLWKKGTYVPFSIYLSSLRSLRIKTKEGRCPRGNACPFAHKGSLRYPCSLSLIPAMLILLFVLFSLTRRGEGTGPTIAMENKGELGGRPVSEMAERGEVPPGYDSDEGAQIA